MLLALWQLHKVRWFYFSVFCKVVVNSTLGENSKKPPSSKILTEVLFNDDSNEKTLNINKVY